MLIATVYVSVCQKRFVSRQLNIFAMFVVSTLFLYYFSFVVVSPLAKFVFVLFPLEHSHLLLPMSRLSAVEAESRESFGFPETPSATT